MENWMKAVKVREQASLLKANVEFCKDKIYKWEKELKQLKANIFVEKETLKDYEEKIKIFEELAEKLEEEGE